MIGVISDVPQAMPGPNRRNAPQHGWLGINVAAATKGAEVQNVTPDSAAEKAGLKNGDRIKRVHGTEIHSPDEVIETLAKMPPNKKVTLVVNRKDKEMELEAILGGRGESCNKIIGAAARSAIGGGDSRRPFPTTSRFRRWIAADRCSTSTAAAKA